MKKRPEEANLKEDAWKDYENAGKGQENENDPREALFGGTERERLEVVVFDRNDWKRSILPERPDDILRTTGRVATGCVQ